MSINSIKPVGSFVEKIINKADELSGAGQRLVIGVTALATQPEIDWFNPNIDKKTRNISVSKTIARIIVGTAIGVITRKYAIDLARYMTRRNIISPIRDVIKNNPENLEKFHKTVGTFLGVIAALIFNFTIDVPLANKFMNFLNKKLCSGKEANNGHS